MLSRTKKNTILNRVFTRAANEGDMLVKLARLASVKRNIATPSQSPVIAPPATKARGEPDFPPVPKFPSPVVDPMVAALNALTVEVQGMRLEGAALTVEVQGMRLEGATKKDLEMMATKADLLELRSGIR